MSEIEREYIPLFQEIEARFEEHTKDLQTAYEEISIDRADAENEYNRLMEEIESQHKAE